MSRTIKLKRKITLTVPNKEPQVWREITLRDAEAGDIMDAGREAAEGATRTEIEIRVAGKCSDVPLHILRKMRPVDLAQISAWYDAQWADSGADEDGDDPENPSQAAGAPAQS